MNNIMNQCVGCGLCKPVFKDKVDFGLDSNGFLRPKFKENYDKSLLNSICPIFNSPAKYSTKMWGDYDDAFLGASSDSLIRFEASSGGVITQVLVYLLEKNKIDGVVHIGVSKQHPLKNIVCLSKSREEVIQNSGSRYSPSSPLVNIDEYLGNGKKYAFVGKPCDVRALKNYEKIKSTVKESFPYVISFFCAGIPSYKATEELITDLGVHEDEVESLRYRGRGWPGFATVRDINENEYKMTYDESWGSILSKDIQPYCRWCSDGTGEYADISCGDAWYLTKENKPDFSEKDGRSVIIARNNIGLELLKEIAMDKKLEINQFRQIDQSLKYMQAYQFERKATMLAKVLAMKVANKKAPKYDLSVMISWSKNVSISKNIRVFFGTLKRFLNGKIQNID